MTRNLEDIIFRLSDVTQIGFPYLFTKLFSAPNVPEGVEVRVPITDCILKDWQGNEVKFEGGLKF